MEWVAGRNRVGVFRARCRVQEPYRGAARRICSQPGPSPVKFARGVRLLPSVANVPLFSGGDFAAQTGPAGCGDREGRVASSHGTVPIFAAWVRRGQSHFCGLLPKKSGQSPLPQKNMATRTWPWDSIQQSQDGRPAITPVFAACRASASSRPEPSAARKARTRRRTPIPAGRAHIPSKRPSSGQRLWPIYMAARIRPPD